MTAPFVVSGSPPSPCPPRGPSLHGGQGGLPFPPFPDAWGPPQKGTCEATTAAGPLAWTPCAFCLVWTSRLPRGCGAP